MWSIMPQRRLFSSLSIIPFPPSLCSHNCALGATKCTKHYQVQSTSSKNALKYVSKKHFFQGEKKKNINKKLIHSLTSCIRKLNQNKTENPMFKSKEKTTAADFCKSIFLCTHKLLNYWEGKKKNYPTIHCHNGFRGEKG